MSKGNAFENELLEHVLNNADLALIGDATGLRGSTTAGNLYLTLHTADPGEAGSQTTSECAYTSYARVAASRAGAFWTVAANSASPAAEISFPACTGGTETATHFGIGTSITGVGKLLYSGAISPTIAISTGVTPKIGTASTLTED